MENVSFIALSRARALERQMDIVANNVANMSTTGFKSESPLFIEYVQHPQKDEQFSMVMDLASFRNTAPGAINMTGNPLDLALEGDGYFTVSTIDGPRYSRAGNFTLNDSRELVTSSGLPVLDDSGNVITIPANTSEVRINSEGGISTEAGPVGKIGVVRFEKEQNLVQLGNNLYQTNETPVAATDVRVQQGFLEGSNVQAVQEMNTMIEINRQYQSVQKLLQSEHDRLRSAYQKLSRLS